MPPQQEQTLGVPAAEIQAAIQTRLAGPPPAPVTADQWKHVNKLYATFNQSLLWLDDKGVHQPRVSALLTALAGADSDALKLDAYPLAELSRALEAVDNKHATAQQLADADVLLSAAYTAYGETMLTGQIAPSSANQSWHINPLEEHVDSALASDIAGGRFRGRLRSDASAGRGIRFAADEICGLPGARRPGGWQPVPAGRTLKRGDSDSPARIDALRARLRAEGYLADSSAAGAPSSTSAAALDTAGATQDLVERRARGTYGSGHL